MENAIVYTSHNCRTHVWQCKRATSPVFVFPELLLLLGVLELELELLSESDVELASSLAGFAAGFAAPRPHHTGCLLR